MAVHFRRCAGGMLLLAGLCGLGSWCPAQDRDEFRPYLRFHSGDVEPLWGVDDHWSVSLGANWSRHLGAELTLDYFERDLEHTPIGTVAEVSAWNLVPYLRLRRAFASRRLVPYLLAGVGPSFLQRNDLKPSSAGHQVDVEGWTLALAVGGGLEYFIADNVTFGIEGKYLYVQPLSGSIDGQPVNVDMSSPMFTFGLRAFFDGQEPGNLLLAQGPAPKRFYAGLRVGGAVLTDRNWVPGVTLEPEEAALGDSINLTGGLLLGLDLGHHWGIELAGDTVEQNIETTGAGKIGEYGIGTVIPHLRVRLPPLSRRWSPYLFAGLGLAYGEFNDATPAAFGLDIQAQGFYPAVRAGAGLEYFVARNLSLHLEGHWLYTWGHELRIPALANGQGDFAVAAVSIGLRVYLLDF